MMRSQKSECPNLLTRMFSGIRLSYCIVSLFASMLLAFGLYNIHAQSGVTEGGVLGMVLLLEYWFGISPSVTGFVLNALCYLLGWKLLGRKFLVYSTVSTLGFSISYSIFEQFEPLFPAIAEMPLVASLVGALFVGISAGMCVRIGGAPGGDDALAMSLSKFFRVDIQWVYLVSDLVVLLLSLSYIPMRRIFYSLLTVLLSGQIIGIVQKIPLPQEKSSSESTANA